MEHVTLRQPQVDVRLMQDDDHPGCKWSYPVPVDEEEEPPDEETAGAWRNEHQEKKKARRLPG